MKKIKKQILSIVLAIIMVIGSVPMMGWASGSMKVLISSANGPAGSDVNVKVSLSENPGISSMKFRLDYDSSILELKNVEYNSELGGQTIQPQKLSSPVTLIWVSAFENCNLSTTFATLTFTIKEDAEEGSVAAITATFNPDDIYNMDEINVPTEIINGAVEVLTCIPGDINGDQDVNNRDITRMFQYLADWNVEVNEPALDTNGDGTVNNRDLTRLFQYLANWDVEIFCGSIKSCKHSFNLIPALEATCTEKGNTEYYQCNSCKKNFSDSTATTEITIEDTVIEAKGHTIEIIPAVPATYESTGLTEGKRCSVCNETIVAQEVTPILERNEYNVVYNISNNDRYLQSISVNNPNPERYDTNAGLNLSNLKVNGYIFEGWFDGEGASAELIKKIPAGTKGDIELYAHWQEIQYDVTYKLYQTPLGQITDEKYLSFTVSKGLKDLPNPELYNYVFLGWYKDDGTEVKDIPVGTAEDITLNAYWTSKRNLTKAVSSMSEPIVCEDTDNGVYYFAYELGTIENVPVSNAIWTIQSVAGLSQQQSKTITTSTSETNAQEIAKTISDSTVDSATWTLSNEWNNVTSINEEWARQNGMTQEEAEIKSKGSSDTYSITSSNGGSNSTVTNSGTTSLSYDSVVDKKGAGAELEIGLEGKYYGEISGGGNIGVGNIGGKAGFEIGGHLDAGANVSLGRERHTGTDTTTYDTTVNTGSSSWNNGSSQTNSQSSSQSNTVSKALSEIIGNRKQYGSSYSAGGENSESQAFSNTKSSSNNYSTTLTYSSVETNTTTSTYSTDGKREGCYRLVIAGTVHVFGVVGYDVATKSYFVYTYNILDDKTYEFLDYSPDLQFDDCENGALPFEIPYDVYEYVSQETARTSGLHFKTNSADRTAVVTSYDGTDTDVIIPSYISAGTMAYKVVGILEDSFTGNEVRSVVLSKYIDEVPEGAFKNCANLECVSGSFTKIGSEAFSGCFNLQNFYISEKITTIGENAFADVEKITIVACDEKVAQDAASSDAENVVLDISKIDVNAAVVLRVPEIESFEIDGGKKQYSNFSLKSNATTTIVKEIVVHSDKGIPFDFSSENVIIDAIMVQSKDIGLVLSAQNTNLSLSRDSVFDSERGIAVVSRSVEANSTSEEGIDGSLEVNGKIYLFGTIKGEEIISHDGIVFIDENEFNKYKNGMSIITFSSNGGNAIDDTKTVYYGQTYGELPTPERDNYTFAGWYTEAEGGTMITAETPVTALVNQTLYAHWTPNQFTLNYNANGGKVSPTSKTLTFGDSYGTLPTPTRDFHTFDGWYTAASGGTKVSGSTTPSAASNVTIYAHWSQKPIKGWTKVGEVPSGAQIVEQKWSYTLRNYTESGSSSLGGWTKYDTRHTDWTGWSDWATWNPDNGVRNVEWRSVYDHTEYHYYRWTNGSSSYTYKNGNSYWLEENWFTYVLPTSTYGANIGYVGSDKGANLWARADYAGNYSVDKTWSRDIYRDEWRYRDPVYTYYYYQDVNKESGSDPTGSANVSNIQKWVKYREK